MPAVAKHGNGGQRANLVDSLTGSSEAVAETAHIVLHRRDLHCPAWLTPTPPSPHSGRAAIPNASRDSVAPEPALLHDAGQHE